jgi:spermidine dehydrogenase
MADTPKDSSPKPNFSAQERELGMDSIITRRDFLNAVALGTGAALLSANPPGITRAEVPSASTQDPWMDYGGIGDYARSNGNTWEVTNAGHTIRDSLYTERIAQARATGETYDLVIVGGGFSGVAAAFRFLKETQRRRSCLILDNHPVIGGEAKRNEFLVNGQRLIGPQGSNAIWAMGKDGGPYGEIWRDCSLPTQFEFGDLPSHFKPMQFPLDNYLYQIWGDKFENHGYFFETPTPHWVTNPFARGLADTPWPEDMRRDLMRWRAQPVAPFQGDVEAHERWLDTRTYDDYLTKDRKLHPDVSRFLDPIIATGWAGVGADAISAVSGARLLSDTVLSWQKGDVETLGLGGDLASNRTSSNMVFSFPGGNDGVMRAIVKWLNPDVIEGGTSYPEIHNGHIRFEAMDRSNAPCRMRAGATVVDVTHDPENKSKVAVITYVRGGQLSSVRARTVIWAGASWTAKHAIRHLPVEYTAAMDGFSRAPILSVNVALNNWRALYKLGYTACSWRGGFGFTTNIRAPMYIGDYRPALEPDKPTVLTFYTGLAERGSPAAEQGKIARAKLFATSYRDFESQIRRQLTKMLGMAGFDAKRDVAGIVLNRWGHAFLYAGPGFFFGVGGKPAPSAVLRQPVGNLLFAHSELSGIQSSIPAVEEGARAAAQALSFL